MSIADILTALVGWMAKEVKVLVVVVAVALTTLVDSVGGGG